MKILEKTMSEMPNSFTSVEFNNRAVKNGYSRERIVRKGLSSFIRKYADNAYPFSKTWIKRKPNEVGQKKHKHNEFVFSNDSEVINYLKSKGYKVMKPQNEWVEC